MLDEVDTKNVDKKILNEIVEALEAIVFPGFASIKEHMEGMEKRIDSRIDGLEVKIDCMEGRLGSVEETMGGLIGSVEKLEVKVDKLEVKVDKLEDGMSDVKLRLNVVEKKIDGLVETSAVVKDHETRIKKVERAVLA